MPHPPEITRPSRPSRTDVHGGAEYPVCRPLPVASSCTQWARGTCPGRESSGGRTGYLSRVGAREVRQHPLALEGGTSAGQDGRCPRGAGSAFEGRAGALRADGC